MLSIHPREVDAGNRRDVTIGGIPPLLRPYVNPPVYFHPDSLPSHVQWQLPGIPGSEPPPGSAADDIQLVPGSLHLSTDGKELLITVNVARGAIPGDYPVFLIDSAGSSP